MENVVVPGNVFSGDSIDVLSGEAFWVFTSIDPETGDQPRDDPFAGLLPINNEQADGEGFVSNLVRPSFIALFVFTHPV